jgi:ATP-binding cassette subfamily B (MDR/TAP) protein 1
VGLTLTGVATFFAAIVVGFARSWRLTLVMLSVTVAIILVMGGLGSAMKKLQAKAIDASAVGGTWAEEAISSIRTVTAFGTQDKLSVQYDVQLQKASKLDFKAKTALASMIALMMAILCLQYGLAFWQGSRFLRDGDVTVSQILTVIFASMLEDFNLTIPSKKVTALVGASGSGKSTVVGLIERFYLPVNGELCLDSHNIQDLNLRWLRRQISMVSQEPVLFSTTIYSNIEFGLIGTEYEGVSKLAISFGHRNRSPLAIVYTNLLCRQVKKSKPNSSKMRPKSPTLRNSYLAYQMDFKPAWEIVGLVSQEGRNNG